MNRVCAAFYATAPKSLWPDFPEPIPFADNDNPSWGVPKEPDENKEDSDWYMHAAEWERMNNTFTPANTYLSPWNHDYDGQDQENQLNITMDGHSDVEDIVGQIEAGTYRHSA
jgi:hypothetical protein